MQFELGKDTDYTRIQSNIYRKVGTITGALGNPIAYDGTANAAQVAEWVTGSWVNAKAYEVIKIRNNYAVPCYLTAYKVWRSLSKSTGDALHDNSPRDSMFSSWNAQSNGGLDTSGSGTGTADVELDMSMAMPCMKDRYGWKVGKKIHCLLNTGEETTLKLSKRMFRRYEDTSTTPATYPSGCVGWLIKMHGPIGHKIDGLGSKPGYQDCKVDWNSTTRYYTKGGTGIAGNMRQDEWIDPTYDTSLEVAVDNVPDLDVNDPD
jgi:hypothetical protein